MSLKLYCKDNNSQQEKLVFYDAISTIYKRMDKIESCGLIQE